MIGATRQRKVPAIRTFTPVARRFPVNHRILVVDDSESIQADFRKILGPDAAEEAFNAEEASVFGEPTPLSHRANFSMDFAFQGQEALKLVRRAVSRDRRYAVAFLDMRMPPGWDGLTTTQKLWEADPDLQIVICTAYSDYSWEEMMEATGAPERLLILKKPFDAIEVLQLAHALTEKWSLLQAARSNTADLEQLVAERTADLYGTNVLLETEVAERRQAQRVVQKSEREQRDLATQLELERARLVAAQAVAKVGSWEIDLITQAVAWSDQTYRIFEMDPASFQPTHDAFIQFLHPDDRATVERNFSASIEECRSGADQYRIVLADGRLKVVEERWQIVCDEAGKPLRATGTVQDVTERNEAHVALQKEREFLAALVENVSDGIVACDARGVITLFNGATREFHGLPAEPIAADRWAEHFDLYLPDGKTLMTKEQIPLFRALQEGFVRDAEIVIAPQNGIARRFLASGRAFTNESGEKAGAVVAMHDITAAKEAEEKLSRSHQLMEAVTEGTTDAIFAKDADGRYSMINTAGAAFLSATPVEVIGQHDSKFFEGETLAQILERDADILQNGEIRTVENVSTAGGVTRTYLSLRGPLRDPAGRIAGVVGYARDISYLKRAEEALRQSESELRTLVESIPQIVWITRPDGWHLHFNQRWTDYTGLTLEESVGHGWNPPFHPDDRVKAAKRWQEAVETGEAYEIEYRLRRADGNYRWMLGRALPLRDATGSITKWLGTCTDIEDLKRAAESARENEREQRALAAQLEAERARLVAAQAAAKLGDWEHDFLTGARSWSAETYRIFEFGENQPDLLHDWFLSIVHPEDEARVNAAAEASLGMHTPCVQEHRLLMPDGRIKFIEQNWQVFHDADGRPIRSAGTIQDITASAEATRTLQKEREFLAALIENVTDGVVACDAAGTISLFNGATREFHGLPAEPVSPDDWAAHFDLYSVDGITPMPKEQIPLYLALQNSSVRDLEMIIAPRHGKIRRVVASGRAFADASGEKAGAVVVMHDITERFAADEALRQSEVALARSQRMAHLGSWEIDLVDLDEIDRNPLQRSAETFRIFGRPPPVAATASTAEFFEQVHPDDRERVSAAFKQMFVTGADCHIDHRILLPDGSERVVHEQAALVLDPKSQRRVKVVGTVQDITERERAEAQMRLQASMIDLAHDAIVVQDLDDRVELWNRGAQNLYGWTAEEVRGRRIEDFLYSDPKPFLIAQQSVLRDGDWTGELMQLCKDGRTVTVRCRWTLLESDTGKPRSILAINTDVTEQKALEAQFMRAQRLESIGTLASGVAHDLNNILSPILMSVPLLRTPLSDEVKGKLLSIVEQSAERGAAVVKQVLTFARGADGEKVLVQPTYLVKEIAGIAEGTFPNNINVCSECPDDLWLISGDATELHQVLLNLCVNARDAMPEGGSLSIKAENFEVDAHYASMTPGAQAGPHVLLTVSDTGTGIPPQVIEKIFDPFFTTKEEGKGTGLGLSTALGIVKNHGGVLNVDSTTKGTTFRILLPAAPGAQQASAAADPVDLPRGQGETILIVDDEPVTREVAQALLAHNGYIVLTADDGPAALAIFARRSAEIRLVMTDFSMPLMSGMTLARALRKMDASTKIVISTGRDEDCNPAEAKSIGIEATLAKPYTQEKLLGTLGRLLHTGVPGTP